MMGKKNKGIGFMVQGFRRTIIGEMNRGWFREEVQVFVVCYSPVVAKLGVRQLGRGGLLSLDVLLIQMRLV